MIAGTLLLQALIVAAIGPETKNRSLEEIAGAATVETPPEADTIPASALK
jgi:MFS transporter, putative metabolite:H+ symporter